MGSNTLIFAEARSEDLTCYKVLEISSLRIVKDRNYWDHCFDFFNSSEIREQLQYLLEFASFSG